MAGKRKYSGYSAATKRRKMAYRLRKKRYRNVRGKGRLVGTIKRTIIKMSEPKNKSYSHGKIELYHNSGSPASGRILPTSIQLDGVSQVPAQGDGDSARNGDQIYTKGISVRMLLGQKSDRMNVTFRVIVIRVTPQSEPTSVSNMFDNVTGNILLDYCNTDRFKVVYQKFIKKTITPQLSPETPDDRREITHTHKFWIPRRSLLKFRDDGATEYAGYRHYMYVFAYDAYGTLNTDNIGYVQTVSNLYYADP